MAVFLYHNFPSRQTIINNVISLPNLTGVLRQRTNRNINAFGIHLKTNLYQIISLC